MSTGPLGVAWGAWTLVAAPQAGVLEGGSVVVENTGAMAWNGEIFLSYHWLDDRGNPIHWDGIRTPVPPLAPGERATVQLAVRAPVPPGRYRLALDLVAERRAWFSELGSPMLELDLDVLPRVQEPNAALPDWVEPAPDWAERVRAAHADGYAVVAGAIAWDGGVLRRRPRALAPYRPGPGRVPGFASPLLCPSVAPGVELDRLDDVAGLPAFAAPREEPWVYDGRIVLTARPRSGRRRA
jgi:hypothetical protein